VRTLAFAVALALAIVIASIAQARAQTNRHRDTPTMRMLASAYCDHGTTKSGVLTRPGVVAADARHLPIGTKLSVVEPGKPYAGVYTVLDTGSAIKGRDLDIFMPSCARAKKFGKRHVRVRILR
jgi:3D (Asp-Asp-Asp) domain-containing protein